MRRMRTVGVMAGAEKTLYDILQVRVDAGTDVIHRAWRLAILENHPDRVAHLGTDAEEAASNASAQLNYALWVLSDPERRHRYDLEAGVRKAPCGKCGKEGRLRLCPDGVGRGYCGECWKSVNYRHARAHSSGATDSVSFDSN